MAEFEEQLQYKQDLYTSMLEANKHVATVLKLLDRTRPASVLLLRQSITILNEAFAQWQSLQR